MTPTADAALALHLELASTPTPGSVDRERDAAGLRFEQFQAGAVGAREGLAALADGASVGAGFEHAVRGMAEAAGTNTQFGSLLLMAPLVRAAGAARLSPDGAAAIVEDTTVDDAAAFYRALEHVDVAVPDPPDDWGPLDARRGAAAIPAVRERELTLADVLAGSAPRDLNAAEWIEGFPRTHRIANRIQAASGSPLDRAAAAYLDQLATEPDTLICTQHGEAVAAEVRSRADTLRTADPSPADCRAFAEELVDRGINPGTTADLLAGGLFLARRNGMSV
ncbi:MAG: triphosphoribosyl-dephospho-CoA synthase [Halanaeroarchaeum sp.]